LVVQSLVRWMGRGIGLDLHRDFCEVAICEDGVVRSAGRVAMTPEALEALAASLEATDRVAMEVSGGAWEVARILEPHVDRVVVVSPDDTGIAQARTKTDRLDARALASLLWRGELEAVWMPDERARVVRRRLARREQLVRTRTRVKNEVHATLMRRLKGKPPCSDLFGVKGRKWLRALERDLPPEEAETIQAALRHIAFLDREIEQVERLVAKQMLTWPESKRLLTVPGVNLIAAATFLAAVGDMPAFVTPSGWSPTWGWTPGCASPASSPPARAASQSAGLCRRAGRWSRRPGRWSTSPGRCARSICGSARAAATARRSSPPPANWRSCSGACSPAARTTPTSSRR
jgi:transposase